MDVTAARNPYIGDHGACAINNRIHCKHGEGISVLKTTGSLVEDAHSVGNGFGLVWWPSVWQPVELL